MAGINLEIKREQLFELCEFLPVKYDACKGNGWLPRHRKYADNTSDLFVKLYTRYKMPASVHKILIHAEDMTDTFALNQEVKQHNTRKICRNK